MDLGSIAPGRAGSSPVIRTSPSCLLYTSGKSSLLKLICGEDISYTGRFYRAAGLKISYVPQDVSFLRGSLTQYAHSCGVDITLFKALLRKLDFSREQFEKDMRSYSEGQKKKVLLARSLAEQAHIYIWDEPLNYIDVLDVYKRQPLHQPEREPG